MAEHLAAMACKCGTVMTTTRDGGDIKWCLNCDQPQPQEHCSCTSSDSPNCDRKPRVSTAQDHRFELAWKQLIRLYYVGGA